MNNCWNLAFFCSDNNRDGYETALGKYNVRFQFLKKLFGFVETFENPERIGKVLRIKVTSELA